MIAFIRGLLVFILVFIVFAWTAPSVVSWVLDKTTSEEVKKIQRETEEYNNRVKQFQDRRKAEKGVN